MKIRKTLVATLLALCCMPMNAQEKYFLPAGKEAASPDAAGFIRRWTVLEPISKPNRSNTVFTDSYLRTVFAKEYFPKQMTIIPKDGQKVKAFFEKVEQPADFRRAPQGPQKVITGTEQLKWHALDSKTYNLKLMRFGEHHIKRLYGVIYWVVTVINCEEEMRDVRLSVGSNSASQWWVNSSEVLLLSGDRRMVADDCMSHRITLRKGVNVIRGAIINGPGMSDFCVRIVDENGKPIRSGYTIR